MLQNYRCRYSKSRYNTESSLLIHLLIKKQPINPKSQLLFFGSRSQFFHDGDNTYSRHPRAALPAQGRGGRGGAKCRTWAGIGSPLIRPSDITFGQCFSPMHIWSQIALKTKALPSRWCRPDTRLQRLGSHDVVRNGLLLDYDCCMNWLQLSAQPCSIRNLTTGSSGRPKSNPRGSTTALHLAIQWLQSRSEPATRSVTKKKENSGSDIYNHRKVH